MKRILMLLVLGLILGFPAWSDPVIGTITGPDRSNPGGYFCQLPPSTDIHTHDVVRFERDGQALGEGTVLQVRVDGQTVKPRDPKLALKAGDTVIYVGAASP